MFKMSSTYQTVIYDKPSGSILLVAPNLYISSKAHLARLVDRPHWADVGFIYFPYDLEIDLSDHSIRSLSSNSPPSLVTKSGIPIEFDLIIQERRTILKKGVLCLVEFEGGMGDQLMEASAVLTAIKKYPSSSFAIKCQQKYLNIIRRIPGIPQVESSYVGQSKDQFSFVVSNHTNYISDPRGGNFGKASLYGAWLGLDSVSKVVNIKLTPADYQAEQPFLSAFDFKSKRLNVMCQFRSGSGHGKSWQGEKVIKLAALFSAKSPCNFFVVGSQNELAAGQPNIIDLTGKSSWWQTCLLLSKMDLVICIDSGVMHLSRSLSIPHITLWGGTNAHIILGEYEAEHDIRLPLDCYDLVCYDCQRKSNACMVKITPDMVFHNAHLLLDLSK